MPIKSLCKRNSSSEFKSWPSWWILMPRTLFNLKIFTFSLFPSPVPTHHKKTKPKKKKKTGIQFFFLLLIVGEIIDGIFWGENAAPLGSVVPMDEFFLRWIFRGTVLTNWEIRNHPKAHQLTRFFQAFYCVATGKLWCFISHRWFLPTHWYFTPYP